MTKEELLKLADNLIAERNELEKRFGKLEEFVKNAPFNQDIGEEQQTLLLQQFEAMIAYKTALTSRIQLIYGDYRLRTNELLVYQTRK